ncbi:hypothetical protein JCM11251_000219 [Rhodosporidiobolus azoricus]
MPASSSCSPRELYGGAIASSLPTAFLDASDLRQVPDTQEVFLSPDSDLSLIVEVLELVKDDGAADSLEAAARFHFSSLAHDNSALSSTVTSVSLPSSTSASQPPSSSSSSSSLQPTLVGPTLLTGRQTVSKFNRPDSEADEVFIQLALWRVPERDADVTLCVNWPVSKGDGGDAGEGGEAEAERVFEEAVRSFEVKDFGLFAGGA